MTLTYSLQRNRSRESGDWDCEWPSHSAYVSVTLRGSPPHNLPCSNRAVYALQGPKPFHVPHYVCEAHLPAKADDDFNT